MPHDPLSRASQAYKLGQYELCHHECLAILKTSPLEFGAILYDGFAEMALRRFPFAKSRFAQAVKLQPTSVEAQVALATALFALKEIAAAKEVGMAAINLNPFDLEVRENIAEQVLHAGDLDFALQQYQDILDLNPNAASALRRIAEIHTKLGRFKEAKESWMGLIDIDDKSMVAHLQLGNLEILQNNLEGAKIWAKKALELSHESVEANLLAGLANSGSGYGADATGYFRKVVAMVPMHPIGNASLGLALQEQGDFERANDHLRRSLKVWPNNGMAYYGLARSAKQKDDLLAQSIRQALKHPAAQVLDLSYMHYALGKCSEDLTDYQAAFSHYKQANELAFEFWFSKRPFHHERHQQTVTQAIETFKRLKGSRGRLRIEQTQSPSPVFIIGMIRSGTTLLDQIISSHPLVSAAGEITYWHDNAAKLIAPKDGEATQETLDNLAERYLQFIQEFADGKPFVTDKLPNNYELAGLIHLALPQAKFVHIKRHPLDNCLSIFSTAYQRPPAFANRQADIVFVYKQYERIMSFWREVIPSSQLLEVQYENLTTNQEEETKRIIQFLQLPWDETCLSPELNKRSVHTPSTWQVRQPVYRSSVSRWKKFEPWLEEFRSLAEGSKFLS